MKRTRRIAALGLAGILSCALLLSGCGGQSGEEGGNDRPGKAETPKLTALTVDGGYELSFRAEEHDYEIRIPAGRPRVPHIAAEAAEGVDITLTQAVLPDGAAEGTAYADAVNSAGGRATYTVRFVRDEALGFHLQYDDYYSFAVEGAERYESSGSALTVSQSGVIHAAAISDASVTVTAYGAGGAKLDSLTVDRVVAAPLNIFLITGQSNAYGTYDIPAGVSEADFTREQMAQTLCPAPGTVLCTDVSNTGAILEDMYDLSVGRKGFSPALGKTWYDLTGEKTLMLQTAVGGAPIEAWMKPENGTRYTYGSASSNFYETTYNAYQHCLAQIESAGSGYELNRVHAYWLQGETGMASSFNPNKLAPGIGDWDFGSMSNFVDARRYYDMFMQNMAYFRDDFHCTFMGILLVRGVVEVCSAESLQLQLYTDLVPARAAQYALHNTNDTRISIVSRICDIARTITWEDMTDRGWGMMGSGNLHYNQLGHNANGIEAANNTYLTFYDRDSRVAYDLEVILENGRDRVSDGDEIRVVAGEGYQTAAMVLPTYTDTPLVTYEVADESVCTIDRFGLITPAADAAGKETTITYRCPAAGLEKTVTVKVGSRTVSEIVYEWNFDKGDLTEKNGKNNLTVSEKTGGNAAYTIQNGIYTSTNNLTNFAMEHPVRLTSDRDWTIEWRGMVETNSALFGTAGNWTNFMYIAYSVPFEVENPLRVVGSDGTALMIPYGDYAGYNTKGMNTWKLSYVASAKRAMLYLNNTIPVGTVDVPAGWTAEFTNLFGSYTTEVNVDYWGSMDWVRISTTQEQITY